MALISYVATRTVTQETLGCKQEADVHKKNLLLALLFISGLNSGTATGQELDCRTLENQRQCESETVCLWKVGGKSGQFCDWRSISDPRVDALESRYTDAIVALQMCGYWPRSEAVRRALAKDVRLLLPTASENEVSAVTVVAGTMVTFGRSGLFDGKARPKLSKDECKKLRAKYSDLFSNPAQAGSSEGSVTAPPNIGKKKKSISRGGTDQEGGSGRGSLTSGQYTVVASGHTATFTLSVRGSNFSGSSRWTCCPGPRVDPIVRGRIQNGKISFIRECSHNHPGPCSQVYTGTIANRRASGQWSGTGGGGTWIMYKQ
jgi:hypothetical protein